MKWSGGSVKISTITPVYNNELYLKECIQSLLNQSYINIEHIFVDDGSTDASFKILQSYASQSSNMRIIRHSHNMGIAAAYRDALQIAQGEVLMLLDADDVAMADRAEKAANAFDDPKVGIMYSKLELINSEGQKFNLPMEIPDGLTNDNYFMHLFRRGIFVGSGLSIRKTPWLSFDSDVICCDYALSLQFAEKKYHFVYEQEPLTQYRIHGRNTSDQSTRMKRDTIAIQQLYNKHKLSTDWMDQGHSLADIHTTFGIMYYYYYEDLITAEEHFQLALEAGGTAEAYFYLGCISYRQENLDRALEYFIKSFDLLPNHFAIVHNVGILTAMVKGDKESHALRLLQKAKDIQPFYLLISKNMAAISSGNIDQLKPIHYLYDPDLVYNSYCRIHQ